MSSRYKLDRAANGTYAIVDVFTGWTAVYLGKELRNIPADMAESGLQMLNALDSAERAWRDHQVSVAGLSLQN